MTDTIEGDHKGRALTRYCRTGSLDRKKRYNLNKIPPDKSRAVAKSPQVKVLYVCVRACCLRRTCNTNSLVLVYKASHAG